MLTTDPTTFLSEISISRKAHTLPPRLRELSEEFSLRALALLFPHFRAEGLAEGTLEQEMVELAKVASAAILPLLQPSGRTCREPVQTLLENLGPIRHKLLLDAEAMWEADPAAASLDEVILAYPGFVAISLHRLANCLQRCDIPLFPRLISEYAHRQTGIDIHPGATIGERFGIDHGTGIVIGQTSIIGQNVRLFQGVTLGALSVRKELEGLKRHPTLEDGVIVYAGATILGGRTVIGRNSVIGGNVWLTESVPPESVVTFSSRTRRKSDPELEYYL